MKGICKLCLQEKDLIKRSHIWPNFMYKGMQDEKGRLYVINSEQPLRKKTAQSGAYQQFIFCNECDNVILGRLERYASNNLYNKPYLLNNADFQQMLIKDDLTIIKCNSLDYVRFKLFLLSLLWRASISTEPIFENFKLSCENEEFLRSSIYESSIVDENVFPCILVTSSAASLDKNLIAVDPFISGMVKFYINSFVYIFYLAENKKDQSTRTLSISMDNNMGIMKFKSKKWNEIRNSVLKAAVTLSNKN